VPKSLTHTYPEAFKDELGANSGAMLRVAALLGSMAFVAMFVVDPYLAEGDELVAARALRVTTIGLLAIVFAVSFRSGWARRWARAASIFECLLTGGTVIALTYLTGGGSSDYHEALYVTLFGYALLPVPWKRWDPFIVFTLLFVGYVATMVLGSRMGPVGAFATHNALLGAAVIVAAVLNRIVMSGRLTSFLARSELAKANTQLKALDEAKSRFFANLSHELRTPLTLTIAPLDALLEGGREVLTEGQREKLHLAQRNALRLLRLVDDLLALTKAEAASLRLQIERLDVAVMIDVLAADVGGLTARKGIELVLDVAPDLPPIEADRHLVERVLLNLVGNAAKFTSDGGSITVRVRGEGDGVSIAVQDTGIGIGPQDLPHIFDRFYQADSGSRRKVGGTGIGLALVREIIDLHRGRISAESVVGEGTTITSWLPVTSAFNPERVTSAAEEAGDLPTSSDGLPEWHQAIRSARSYRLQGIDDATERRIAPRPSHKGNAPMVLVVEDNPDMIRFLVALLASDYNVLSAQNGQDGLRMAIERRPDLIISDVMMPEMNGFEMLERLRADQATHAIPLIFLTARGSAEDRVLGRQVGAETYLAKPFRSEELLAAVDALLSHQHDMRDDATAHHDEALLFLASGVAEQIARTLAALESAGADDAREQALVGLAALAAQLRAVTQVGAEPVAAPAVVDDCVRSVVADLAAAHPDVAVHATLDAPGLAAIAPDELSEVVRCLVARAIAQSPPHASVQVATERQPNGAVIVRVHDEGPGLPARDVERVFFAFYDGDDAARGLGLVRIRRLLEARGGALTVAPSGLIGTTFIARLASQDAAIADGTA
jgi:signal transduction histidine kinase